MPPVKSRADSLMEWLTGAASDGGAQTDPNASLGHFRSSTEAVSLGIAVAGLPAGVTILYAGGANPPGIGTLTAVDGFNLTWQPAGAAGPGPMVTYPAGTLTQIVEAAGAPGQYLRIQGATPFTPGVAQITLSILFNNFFGLDNVSIAQAASGENEYRATILRNESTGTVSGVQRWIGQLGTSQVQATGLPGAGAGSISTAGSFVDWPMTGFCQVRTAGGTLKEVVYYSGRTANALTVPASGRALLGTSAQVGVNTDHVYSVPGIAIAKDPTGVVAFGSAIQTIANANTVPTGVTWNLEITPTSGLQVGSMNAGTQIGLWIWRQVPAGSIATGIEEKFLETDFQAF